MYSRDCLSNVFMALTRRELNERGEHLSLGSIVNTVVFIDQV
ncbi:hypothetical protein HMPREF0493_1163 [Lactobacillus amylolyticus DSM 11664]|uniref:Uncharacterized protein n=1 Tax=Lactobacillus amylolyticus DSM 11664 TaxID=585524 RepID=D4YUF2_9LACO|nr:hypothetical protein HMPREF0493_1163 [Lactobacillus amylolyticus DSM 11664]